MRAVCMPIIGGGTGEAQAGAVVACRDRPPPARRFGKGALAKEGELERGWACWEDDEKRMYCTDKQRPAAAGGSPGGLHKTQLLLPPQPAARDQQQPAQGRWDGVPPAKGQAAVLVLDIH